MAWTSPKTWAVNELVTAADMNTYISDNLSYLKTRMDDDPSEYTLNESSDYTTTSLTFVDVDATNLAITVETQRANANVLVHFDALVDMGSAGQQVLFDIDVDGNRLGGDDGVAGTTHVNTSVATMRKQVSFTRYITGLSQGSHTFKLHGRITASATAKIFAGAGTSGLDIHPQFWAREV